jgi:hypothetical protein
MLVSKVPSASLGMTQSIENRKTKCLQNKKSATSVSCGLFQLKNIPV